MTTVPSNLIPTRITQLPEYQGTSTAGFLPYVIDGVTYKVQFSNIAAVGAVPSSRTIIGGSGLTGGGDLSADRVISIAAGGVGFGQLADSGVVAGVYGDSSNIPVLTVDVKGRVTVATTTPIDLSAYVPTSRSITAGAGLTGGGTLAADRTISLVLSTALPESGGTPGAGTATVAAREDHVHPAVDLSDATETSGALPMSRGGTGSSLSPVAGAILYSDGSNVDLSNPGTANQLLFSEGTAAPTWRSLTGGTTGLTFDLSGSNYALAGTLAVANGGTGATTAPAARVNLLPDYSGNAGRVLAVNALADDVEWIAVSGGGGGGSGTVTSVDLTAGTGISVSGGPITTSGSITVTNTAPDQVVVLTAGTNVSITGTYPSFTINSTDQFVGTVTSVSVVSANGLAGTVATDTTTPAITLSTSVSGIVKGNGAAFSAAVAGTDYVAPGAITTSGLTVATARLLGRTTAGTGAAEEITVGSGLTLSAGTLTATGGGTGTVTSVDVSGGTTGLSFSGGPVTTSGTITMAGTLAVANGGTGQTSYTDGQLLIGNSTGNTLSKSTLTAGSGISITNGSGSITIASTSGGGSVTDVSVVSANGLAGTVANSATTPAITLSTTVTGVVKGNGTALSAASAGTDYVAPGAYTTSGLTMATDRLLGRTTAGTGAAEEITVGTGLLLSAGSLTNSAPDQTVVLTGGTGISTSGTYPSFTITNTAPDQTVVLTAGTNVSITGTYPSFTINSTDQFVGTVTSVDVSGGTTGLSFSGGPVTSSGTITLAGTLSIANGGTGSTTAGAARTALGSTTVGDNLFTLTNPSAITFLRVNADNTVSTLDAASFRTAIGAGTGNGTVTSVGGTGTVNGITLTGTVTSSGNLTLGGTLSGVDLTSQVTGTLPVANGGTGQTSYTNGQLLIGNTTGNTLTKATLTAGTNISITNGAGSITINSTDQFVGTVTSVGGTGTVNGLTLTGTVTSSGNLTLGGTLSVDLSTATVTGTLPVGRGGTGATTLTGVVIGNGTSAFTDKTNPTGAFVGTTDTQTLTNKTLEKAVLNDGYTEEVFAITDGTTVNLDPNNGSIQTWTLGANRTPGQANWAAGQSITLQVDDGSAFTITWTTLAVVWKTDGGTAPTLNLTGFTVIVLWKVGTTIYGARVGDA
jgi:fibronectin-binding autotransporter adhesin